MGPQKLDHLSVFEESCGILVLAIAKEPQFLDLWYTSSVVHKPNSSPVCQPLVSFVWHLCTFVVVVLIFFFVCFGVGFFIFFIVKGACLSVAVISLYIKSFLISSWKLIPAGCPHCRRQAAPRNMNALSLEESSVCPAD